MLRANRFIGKSLCTRNNGVVHIFEESSKPIAMCDRDKGNMFSKQNRSVELVHTAKAWVSFPKMTERQRTEFGAIEGQLMCIHFPRPDVEISTGFWVYVNYLDQDLLGGYLFGINRNRLDGVFHIFVDTGKQVPFSPDFVGVGDWYRGPNV